jgi:hypothetical protein
MKTILENIVRKSARYSNRGGEPKKSINSIDHAISVCYNGESTLRDTDYEWKQRRQSTETPASGETGSLMSLPTTVVRVSK